MLVNVKIEVKRLAKDGFESQPQTTGPPIGSNHPSTPPQHRYLTLPLLTAHSGATALTPSATHTTNAFPKRLDKDQADS